MLSDRLWWTILLTLSAVSGCAATPRIASKDQHVEAQLISEFKSLGPGQTFQLGVDFKIDHGWHIYWKNPGDSGLPVSIEWALPDGYSTTEMEWPLPKKIDQPPLSTYGYENRVLLKTTVRVPSGRAEALHVLRAKVQWLMCAVQCIPGQAELELNLPSASQAIGNPRWIKGLEGQNYPKPATPWNIIARNENRSLVLDLSATGGQKAIYDAYFFAERSDIVNHSAAQRLQKTPKGYRLHVPWSTLVTKPLTEVRGTLAVKQGGGPYHELGWEVNLPVLPPSIPEARKTAPDLNLTLSLVFAFIGGLILNLMPCVLPAVSLKILGFINQAAHDPSQVWKQGLAFTAGVLVSFWVLVAALLFLQAAGHHIGWGFQFQSPGFLTFLALFFFIFALNLFGVFEILLPVSLHHPKRQGYGSAFLNGVVATITATPCSAPFMGTAIGFGLTQSPQTVFLIFSFLGLGMSFPYLLLSMFPSLLKFLPKPGPWMAHFKRALGVLLLATVAWLLWILSSQLQIQSAKPAALEQPHTNVIAWQEFSPELVNQLRAEQRIIFIDFTARWCLTCQVNERVALNNPRVVEKFRELNVAALKADWTNPNEDIANALAGFGKSSIPLYVLYGREATSAPIVLPELITPGHVLEALEKAADW